MCIPSMHVHSQHACAFPAILISIANEEICIEPSILMNWIEISQAQPLNGEQVSSGSVTGDEARLDIRARGFWHSGQSAFFDIHVTNTNVDSARALSTS